MKPLPLALLLLTSLGAPAAAQNLVINGDFENTSAVGCQFNLSNATFNSLLPNCTGFSVRLGGAGEIDIMQGGACGYGLNPQSGLVKLGIANNNDPDEEGFSMDLSAPVVAGRSYKLVFHANAHLSSFSTQIGSVEVGLSASPTSFGTLIYTGTPSSTAWTRFEHTFSAPVGAGYLTVRHSLFVDAWTHVDNFSLEPAGFDLALGGTCPGLMTASVTGATPNGSVAFVYAFAAGGFTIPAGYPCAGTALGLAQPVRLAGVAAASSSGAASLSGNAPAAACGRVLVQAVDLASCAVSDVEAL